MSRARQRGARSTRMSPTTPRYARRRDRARHRFLGITVPLIAGCATITVALVLQGILLTTRHRPEPTAAPLISTPTQEHAATTRLSRVPHVPTQTASERPLSAAAGARLAQELDTTTLVASKAAAGLEEVKAVIQDNPKQAISYTLLEREVHADQESDARALSGVEKSVGSEYDLMKWLVGVLMLGILGMLVPLTAAAVKGKSSQQQ
jgi:hypothetical protein